jgi:hypothetical protein
MDLPFCSGLVLRSLGSGTSPPLQHKHISSPVYANHVLGHFVHSTISTFSASPSTLDSKAALQKLSTYGSSLKRYISAFLQMHLFLGLLNRDLLKIGPHCRGPG